MPAYVIIWVDYEQRPPTAVRADICSEEFPSSTMSVVPQCVMKLEGSDKPYSQCVDIVMSEIELRAQTEPQYKWVLEHLERKWIGEGGDE